MYPCRLLALLTIVLFLSGPAMAQNSFVIDTVTSRSDAAKGLVNVSGVEVVNTNLSRRIRRRTRSCRSP